MIRLFCFYFILFRWYDYVLYVIFFREGKRWSRKISWFTWGIEQKQEEKTIRHSMRMYFYLAIAARHTCNLMFKVFGTTLFFHFGWLSLAHLRCVHATVLLLFSFCHSISSTHRERPKKQEAKRKKSEVVATTTCTWVQSDLDWASLTQFDLYACV